MIQGYPHQSSTVLIANCTTRCRSGKLRPHASASGMQSHSPPLIKICGVTSKEDARLAAEAGADFVGMIMWPKARRSVTVQTAAEISQVARQNGSRPVAVFVDEDFADIVRCCKASGISTAQLHGKGARASLHDLPDWLEVKFDDSSMEQFSEELSLYCGISMSAISQTTNKSCSMLETLPLRGTIL